MLKADETSINSHTRCRDFGASGWYFFYNFGIIPNWSGLSPMDRFFFTPEISSYVERLYKIQEGQFNPFNFKPSIDTLTRDEAIDSLKNLKVLADIKAKGSNDSRKN